MCMDVSVTVPTLFKREKSLRALLNSLTSQTYKDFKVIIITPNLTRNSKERLFALLEESKLDFSICIQNGSGFVNAINTALDVCREINISTDDDAILDKHVIEKYVLALMDNKIGLATGFVNYLPPFFNRTLFLYLSSYFLDSKPLTQNLYGYTTFFNRAGIITLKPTVIFQTLKRFRTLTPIGVNMAWRKEAVKGFRIPEFLKKGILNESYLALVCTERGLEVLSLKEINVLHPKSKDSLSRSKTWIDDFTKIFEYYLSPAIVNRIVPIDIDQLSTYYKQITKISLFNYPMIAKLALQTALEITINNYDDKKIDKLFKNTYGLIKLMNPSFFNN
jgi:glycosyltransferase involved in cell wall biosynthesis